MDYSGEDSDYTCPLCMEEMDLTDRKFQPCQCGYQICLWCWHHIMEMANKDNREGRCPACRSPYDKDKIVSAAPDPEELSDASSDRKQKGPKWKGRAAEGRRHLSNVRVVQRNLVYVVGLPMSLADEETLERRDFFGQYGRILKIAVSRSSSTNPAHNANGPMANVYITYQKEEDAVRCIQAVDGCVFEGRILRACFGTTKYCNSWLKNMPCNNPDCLYLHEIGTQEDSFSKDDMSSKPSGKLQTFHELSYPIPRRAANGLPPPLDGHVEKVAWVASQVQHPPALTAQSHPPPAKPSLLVTSPVVAPSAASSTSTKGGGLLPAAASWGAKSSASGKVVLTASKVPPPSQPGPLSTSLKDSSRSSQNIATAAAASASRPASSSSALTSSSSSSSASSSSTSSSSSSSSPPTPWPSLNGQQQSIALQQQQQQYKPSAAVLSSRVIHASAHSPPVVSPLSTGSAAASSAAAAAPVVSSAAPSKGSKSPPSPPRKAWSGEGASLVSGAAAGPPPFSLGLAGSTRPTVAETLQKSLAAGTAAASASASSSQSGSGLQVLGKTKSRMVVLGQGGIPMTAPASTTSISASSSTSKSSSLLYPEEKKGSNAANVSASGISQGGEKEQKGPPPGFSAAKVERAEAGKAHLAKAEAAGSNGIKAISKEESNEGLNEALNASKGTLSGKKSKSRETESDRKSKDPRSQSDERVAAQLVASSSGESSSIGIDEIKNKLPDNDELTDVAPADFPLVASEGSVKRGLGIVDNEGEVSGGLSKERVVGFAGPSSAERVHIAEGDEQKMVAHFLSMNWDSSALTASSLRSLQATARKEGATQDSGFGVQRHVARSRFWFAQESEETGMQSLDTAPSVPTVAASSSVAGRPNGIWRPTASIGSFNVEAAAAMAVTTSAAMATAAEAAGLPAMRRPTPPGFVKKAGEKNALGMRGGTVSPDLAGLSAPPGFSVASKMAADAPVAAAAKALPGPPGFVKIEGFSSGSSLSYSVSVNPTAAAAAAVSLPAATGREQEVEFEDPAIMAVGKPSLLLQRPAVAQAAYSDSTSGAFLSSLFASRQSPNLSMQTAASPSAASSAAAAAAMQQMAAMAGSSMQPASYLPGAGVQKGQGQVFGFSSGAVGGQGSVQSAQALTGRHHFNDAGMGSDGSTGQLPLGSNLPPISNGPAVSRLSSWMASARQGRPEEGGLTKNNGNNESSTLLHGMVTSAGGLGSATSSWNISVNGGHTLPLSSSSAAASRLGWSYSFSGQRSQDGPMRRDEAVQKANTVSISQLLGSNNSSSSGLVAAAAANGQMDPSWVSVQKILEAQERQAGLGAEGMGKNGSTTGAQYVQWQSLGQFRTIESSK